MSGTQPSGIQPSGMSPGSYERSRRRGSTYADIAVAILAGVLALGVYIRSLAPGLLWGDSAEFQFAAWLGGFAHPTGYPLYLMLGWLWTHLLPLGDPAFRMNLLSALLGGVAIALFCLLVMRVIRFLAGDKSSDRSGPSLTSKAPAWVSRPIALGAALVFTFTPTLWSQAVIAEVYTLHAVFVTGLLLALLSWAEWSLSGRADGARRRSYLIALLFGLSLAHHRATILLIPAALLFVAIVAAATRPRPSVSIRHLGLLLLCVVAPLLLYLYIPLRAPHVPYYMLPLAPGESLQLYDSTLSGFLAHVSGSVFSSSLVSPRLGALDLAGLFGRFNDELSLNGLLFGGFGLIALFVLALRDRNRRSWAVIALTLGFFVTQVVFNLLYAIGDIHVFYIPAYLVSVVWTAVGAWAIVLAVAWLFSGIGDQARPWTVRAGALLLCAALVALAYRSAVVYWPKVQRAGDDSARRAWDALLSSDIPQGAILVSNDRDEIAPLWYLAHVEGQRTDVAGLFPLIQPGPDWTDVGAVVDAALQTGRPVHLVKPMTGLEVKYELAPAEGQAVGPLGPAVRVSAQPPTTMTHVTDVVYGDTIRLVGYDLTPEPFIAGQPAEVTLYWEPLREMDEDWTTFVQIVDPTGDKAAQSDHPVGGVYYPTRLWDVGEQLRDVHTLSPLPNLSTGTQQLVVGLYAPSEGGLRHLGQPQVVGEVSVSE